MEAKRDPRVHAEHGPLVMRPRPEPSIGCFNPDILFVGPSNGIVHGRADGETWQMAPGIMQPILSAAWAPELGLWVGVGRNTIATSPNGCDWTPRGGTYRPNAIVRKVRWNGELFVATLDVSSTGFLLTSPDGITWTERTLTFVPFNVVWDAEHNQWIVTGVGMIATSPDGITWTNQTAPSAATFDGIAFMPGANRYLVHSAGASTAWHATSLAGPWTALVTGVNGWLSGTKGRVYYDGTRLIIPGNSGGGLTGEAFFTSTDAVNWVRTSLGGNAASGVLVTEVIKTADGLWVMAGASQANTAAALWTSTDFATWTRRFSFGNLTVTGVAFPSDLAAK